MTLHDSTPVLVGAGQAIWRDPDFARTPVDAITEAAASALQDCRSNSITTAIDGLVTVRFIGDTTPEVKPIFPRNPGREVAKRLGLANPALYLGVIGGNTPQYLVNRCCEMLHSGQHRAILLCGAELMSSFFKAIRGNGDISSWAGQLEEEPSVMGADREGVTDAERLHGMFEPINTYPLFENALRHHLGRGLGEHNNYIAQLSARLSQVAAENPYAWRRTALSADEIATVTQKNRYVGYPYTRAMNAVLEVDMAASVVMTTVGTARSLGIDPGHWIFPRGGVDINEVWHVSERRALHRAPAIGMGWRLLADECSVSLDEISHFDIYSCFPSAVEISCAEIGLSPEDARGVTVTGGLPYFGGPGNNYSLHAIAEMAHKLRATEHGLGLVTANGLYLTKHSMGLYSKLPGEKPWRALDSSALQSEVNHAPRMPLAADPAGEAVVDSYTVSFSREGPKKGIVVARTKRGERVVANTSSDPAILEQWIKEDPMGAPGRVRVEDGYHLFEL
ncbi:MAG: acetyl-CoA acetyltransferase [Pseudomonadota bacterium]